MDQNVTDVGHRPDAPNGAWSVPKIPGIPHMGRVSFEVPQDVKHALEKQAGSLGVSLAAYTRKLVLDGSKRDPHAHHAELLKALRIMVQVLVYAMGYTQRQTPDVSRERAQAMVKLYDQWRSGS
jgi:hypothetical protein